jgi:tetratricopeptide (TPR) repeat protein
LPLSAGDSADLLKELLPHVEVPPAWRQAILARSGGNPCHLEESVRLLSEQGLLENMKHTDSPEASAGGIALAVPQSLEALVGSRVGALSPHLRDLAQCAAVIGHSFGVELLMSVSGLPEVRDRLAQLESLGVLCRNSETSAWEFSHALTESVAYKGMHETRRRVLHLRMAEALEAHNRDPECERARELAHHLTQAHAHSRALPYLVLAGEQAAARYSDEEAVAYLQQASLLLEQAPTTMDGARWRIAFCLGDTHRLAGRYRESLCALQDALGAALAGNPGPLVLAGLYRRLGETAQVQGDMRAALGHFAAALSALGEKLDVRAKREATRSLQGMGWMHFLQGRLADACRDGEAALQAARDCGSLREAASAENLLGGVHHRQGQWEEAWHHTMKALSLQERIGCTWGVAACLSNLGVLSVSAGDWGQAASCFRRSLDMRQEMGDVEGMAILHNNLGSLSRDQGDLEASAFHFKEGLDLATSLRMPYHVSNSTLGLAHVLLLKGSPRAAYGLATCGLEQAEAIGARELAAEARRILAECLLAQADYTAALRMAKNAIRLAAEIRHHSLEAASWRVAAEVAMQKRSLSAARVAMGNVWRALADVRDELETGRAAAQAGRLSLLDGDVAQSEEQLQRASEIFERLGAMPDLDRLRNGLGRPAPAHTRRPDDGDTLKKVEANDISARVQRSRPDRPVSGLVGQTPVLAQ